MSQLLTSWVLFSFWANPKFVISKQLSLESIVDNIHSIYIRIYIIENLACIKYVQHCIYFWIFTLLNKAIDGLKHISLKMWLVLNMFNTVYTFEYLHCWIKQNRLMWENMNSMAVLTTIKWKTINPILQNINQV